MRVLQAILPWIPCFSFNTNGSQRPPYHLICRDGSQRSLDAARIFVAPGDGHQADYDDAPAGPGRRETRWNGFRQYCARTVNPENVL